MKNVTLKPNAEITALIESDEHKTVPLKRRQELAGKVMSAPDELHILVPPLLAQTADDNEAAFVRALMTEKPEPAAQKAPPKTEQPGGKPDAVAEKETSAQEVGEDAQ